MFTNIFWRFLILETLVLGALCVSCSKKHPQTHFCTSEFVLKVKFIEQANVSVGHGFKMEMKTIFMGDVEELYIMDNRYVTVELPPNENPTPGNKYIIFGHNKHGNILTNNCYGIKPWGIVTRLYRRGLAKFYWTGCECITEMPIYTLDTSCHWNYSFLVRRGENCSWAKTKEFRLCQKKLLSSPPFGINHLFRHQYMQRKD